MFDLKRKSAASALMLVAFAFASGCGDDTTLIDQTGENNNTRTPNNVPVPEGSKLRHTGDCAGQISCAVDVTFSAARRLPIELLDGDNNPISGAGIEYVLEANDAVGSTLTARTAPTDDSGLASVDLRAGTTQGVAEVTVRTTADERVEPIKFIVAVNSKDRASYRVNFNHNGTSNLRDINVFLYDSTITCEDVRNDMARERDNDPDTIPVLTAESTAVGTVSVDGTMPVVVFPDLANGESYTVSARAMSRDHSGEVELAFGCEGMNPPIEEGRSVDVVVDLLDYLPRLKGSFNVTHTFSITDAICNPNGMGGYDGVLPSGVCLAIDLIGRLATDPASFLLGTGGGDTGLIGLIVDFLPDSGFLGNLKNSIESFLNNSLVNGLGRQALNDFFENWIEDNAPGWVKGAVNITGDIYETLKEFQVQGIIRVHREPEPSFDPQSGAVIGLLEADANGDRPGEQVWSDIIVKWTGECEPGAPSACRERSFSAADLGAQQSVVQGTFTGTVVPSSTPEESAYGLVINDHTLSLNYGVLILGIIEGVILPTIFGPGVNSIEDALDQLLILAVGGDDGCEGLADFVENTVGGGNTVNSIVTNLCQNLLDSASDGLRTFLTENLVLEGADNFVLGTPDDAPCAIHQPDLYSGEWMGKPLPYIQSMGTSSVECAWDVKIRAGSALIQTDGAFHGTRNEF